MVDSENLKILRLNDESSAILNKFKSSDLDLNIFLRRKARKHQNEMLAVTYLLYYFGEIIGYYTLSSDAMPATELVHSEFQKGKQYKSYPAIKIGRLAISEEYATCGYGSWVLNSIKFIYANMEMPIGSRYLLVDAYQNVTNFYLRNGFKFWIEKDENEPTRLMYYDLLKAKKSQ